MQAETNVIMQDFRFALKQKVMATLCIEIGILRKALYNNLVKELNDIVQAKLLYENTKVSPHTIPSLIFYYHSTELLDPFDIP